MAAGTLQGFVLSLEWKAGLPVIELRIVSHFPRVRGVARLARYGELSVRRGLGASRPCCQKTHENGFPDPHHPFLPW